MKKKPYIAYLRVSTNRQGRSGLGLEAQREAINQYLKAQNGHLLEEFVEVESGKRSNNRPMLRAALASCRDTGAILLIAKLDRLARNVAFISHLMESKAEFVACDFPQANRLTIHILAAVAEHEREMISKRTKEALAAAKARGVHLGNPDNLSAEGTAKGINKSRRIRSAKANAFARRRYPEIAAYRTQGLSLSAIAGKLNAAGVLTPRGNTGCWTATTVRNIILRIEREGGPRE